MKQKLLSKFVTYDKLQMMGIPCEDPTFVYGDNNRFWLILMPGSTLKNKVNALPYHFIRDGGMSGAQRM